MPNDSSNCKSCHPNLDIEPRSKQFVWSPKGEFAPLHSSNGGAKDPRHCQWPSQCATTTYSCSAAAEAERQWPETTRKLLTPQDQTTPCSCQTKMPRKTYEYEQRKSYLETLQRYAQVKGKDLTLHKLRKRATLKGECFKTILKDNNENSQAVSLQPKKVPSWYFKVVYRINYNSVNGGPFT